MITEIIKDTRRINKAGFQFSKGPNTGFNTVSKNDIVISGELSFIKIVDEKDIP